ncbi:MAG: hypothetical protein WDW36_005424 [Sanguina aurantia]
MPISQDLSVEQLRNLLDDTQAALAAAFARIEGFRLREKSLMAELSTLRQQVHGGSSDVDPSAGLHLPEGSTDPGAQTPLHMVAEASVEWTSPSLSPVYVTNCEASYPVHIMSAGRKVPASLVVTREFVDFVEVRARVKQEEFIGISTHKVTKMEPVPSPNPPSSSSLLACCFAPPKTRADEAGDRTGGGFSGTPDPLGRSSSPHNGGAGFRNDGGGFRNDPFQGSSQASGLQRNSINNSRNNLDSSRSDSRSDLNSPDLLQQGHASSSGTWQILWKRGEVPQRLVFEASNVTREKIHEHTSRWLGEDGRGAELSVPRHLTAGQHTLNMIGEPSQLMQRGHASALASGLPPLLRFKSWALSYSTARHGISLQTMYRRVVPHCETLLLVKDNGGHIFGCFSPDSWRISPRFYGTGETFVFQLEPYKVMYPWRSLSHEKNDFFLYGTPDCAAVGALGHFAMWLDSELLRGSSGVCGTFGSPCLSHKEDFAIALVEMWQTVP